MATDLYLQLFPKSAELSHPLVLFQSLLYAIESWSAFRGWGSVRCGRGMVSLNAEEEAESPENARKLRTFVVRHAQNPGAWFSADAEFEIWRRQPDGTFAREIMGLSASCWKLDSPRIRLGEEDVEGCARISMTAKPYWALLDETQIENGAEFNQRVEDNLAELKALFDLVIEHANPRSMRICVDEGWTFPWNSHCTYFANYEAVLRDFELIERLWNSGDNYDRPLSPFDAGKHAFAFSTLRTPENRLELWSALNELLPKRPRITRAAIEEVLAAGILDFERHGEGFTIFGGPQFLNEFVQDFYVNVLEFSE